jgi:hypothetical protein
LVLGSTRRLPRRTLPAGIVRWVRPRSGCRAAAPAPGRTRAGWPAGPLPRSACGRSTPCRTSAARGRLDASTTSPSMIHGAPSASSTSATLLNIDGRRPRFDDDDPRPACGTSG